MSQTLIQPQQTGLDPKTVMSKVTSGTESRRTQRRNELSFTQLNVRGLGKHHSKLDSILQTISAGATTHSSNRIIFISETKSSGYIQKEVSKHEVFLHGSESESSAGVGIILGGNSIQAWKDAGSNEPVAVDAR